MEDPEEIPRTILRYDTAHVDWGNFKDGKILFLNPNYVLIGHGDLPHTLFATPQFSEETLLSNIGESIYKVKTILLQSTFMAKKNADNAYYPIPEWISNFKEVDHLTLRQAELDNLEFLEDMPIQQLVLFNVSVHNIDPVIISISQFKNLQTIEYDQSIPKPLIEHLKSLNLTLIPNFNIG